MTNATLLASIRARETVLNESQRIANVGSWELDLRSGRCVATEEFWRIVGCAADPQPLTIESYYAMVHPDDRAGVECRLAHVIAESTSASYDHRIVRPDGSVRYVNARGQAIHDADGALSHLIGIVQDITDRKRDEDRVRFLADASALLAKSLDEDELLRQLATLAVPALGSACLLDVVRGGKHKREIGAADLTRDQFAALNDSLSLLSPIRPGSFFEQMMASPEPVLLSPTPDWFHEMFTADHPRCVDLRQRLPLESVMMVPLLARDHMFGMMSFGTLAGQPRLDERDVEIATELAARAAVAIQNAQLFAALRQELSERLRVERERDTTETFLHAFFESPATYSCVFDIDDANDDWIFVMPNGPYARSYGFTVAEMTGKTAREIGIPDDRVRYFIDILRRSRASGESVSVEVSPSKTVDRIWRLGNIAPFTLNGRPLFAYVATDITERKALEQQVIQAQKMEAVAVLAGGIAHDFNNLITVISGCAELALEDTNPDDPVHEVVVDIKEAADRAGALTRQLLTFSRRQPVRPQLVDVNEIVRHAERMLRRLIGERHELQILLSSSMPVVHMDPGQLEQLLVNLVVNARDAMPNGGSIVVSTTVATRGVPRRDAGRAVSRVEDVEITVSDSGVGMNEEIKARVFEPFFTTKDVGKGTGLGLATVFTIVKSAQGRVSVDSAPGLGTTFTVFLPRAMLSGVSAPEILPPEPVRTGRETILLVEDDPHVRRLACRALADLGYNVVEASSATEALQVAGALDVPLDLLVTDVVLPELDGHDLADVLDVRQPGLKVLFMSGYTAEALAHHRRIANTNAFLEKPFNARRLAMAVRGALESSEGWRKP
ncbi:MAG: ATP-binding protein [bacterium]